MGDPFRARSVHMVDECDIKVCREAVHDYRSAHGIDAAMKPIDDNGVSWRR
ncbi:TylF/MycF/NovP-related O-methyltransferase [Micromonospora echinospora]|uniref:Uncharacterized protein n=1 Tax=Micromonospora echinospora TaxID=1877 RepID=A0ABR6MFJ0_MICEC|nr:TylF/MycF/NovP-related O-methyltransferase [Micromonospora echinospora]MBB5114145.1 hypothetical protein [Micromonospora echinospora]